MNVTGFTIAGGNLTALVTGAPNKSQNEISKKLLERAEQVGFVDLKNQILEMMGRELCINACLATAKLIGGAGDLVTCGQKLKFQCSKNKASVVVCLPFKQLSNKTILFKDIGYIFTTVQLRKSQLKTLSERYNLPAFGCVIAAGGQIYPTIYVRAVNSYVSETACGSASIAASILTGRKQIIQSSGGTIFIDKVNGKFQITAEVKEVGL